MTPNTTVKSQALFAILITAAVSCAQRQSDDLPPQAFSAKLKQTSGAVLLDVRTPEEYVDGHLAQATNIDWNGDNFEPFVSRLDKNAPTFVYCQRGGRSADAADKLRSLGFKKVYELGGGLNAWQAAGLPVVKD